MLETFGWFGIIFTVVGFFVSSLTVAFYMGHKRGLGQFRIVNPFGPSPIVPRMDEQYIRDYEMMKGANSNLNREIFRLKNEQEDLKKEIKTLEGKIRLADRRRAKRDDALTSLYTASNPEEYVTKYQKDKDKEAQEQLVDNVKRYARRKTTASHAQ
jgi:hypothetical protein